MKSSTYGADRSHSGYLSYMRALISILTIIQQYNESTEGISKQLDYTLLNLKLDGDKIHPEALKTKGKYSNSMCNYEGKYVVMEFMLMGTLLIKS